MLSFLPFAIKKMTRWKLVVPFFIFGLLIISNIGILDQYSFIDSDLIFHKSIADKLIDDQLFENDKAMQCYMQIYPKGYHLLLIFLGFFKLTVFQSSKLLGIILCFITPFLFYFLSKEIYKENKAAFIGGLFCGIASIWDTVYMGLPRSIAFVFFIAALLFLFKYRNSPSKVRFLIVFNLLMLLTLFVHPSTFIVLWIVAFAFFAFLFFEKSNEISSMPKSTIFAFLLLIFYAVFLGFFKKETVLGLSSWDFFHKNQDIFLMRVPYASMNLSKLIVGIGILPILMFCKIIFSYYQGPQKTDRSSNLHVLFVCTLFLLIFSILVMGVNALFFLRVHRFIPFISSLLYLSGILAIVDILDRVLKNKVFLILFLLILLSPSIKHLQDQIILSELRYDLNLVLENKEVSQGTKQSFDSVLSLVKYIKENLSKDEVIACSLEKGDLLRMHARRAVTASWKIGGMITVYKKPLEIFKEQIYNSKMLYADPTYLNRQYGAKFFLFEKSKITKNQDIMRGFNILWQSKNMYFSKIIETRVIQND